MSVLATYIHDPEARLDYSMNWAPWLPDGDTIDVSTWSIEPVGPTLSSASVSVSGLVATVYVEGATEGETYILTNHIVTIGAREDDRSVKLKVKDR